MRAVVVGASSGIGRCVGVGLAHHGARVALLARRHDLLVDAAGEAGPGSLAITCDVTEEKSVQAAVAEAADGLGGIDAVVYATGMAVLRPIEELTAEQWRRVLDTNVVGASLVTAAALPHLAASRGVATYISSVSASLTAPWPGLGAYATSKAALDKMIEAWRAEHPQIGFTRVIVGETMGGEGAGLSQFITGWDLEYLGRLFPLWNDRGLLAGTSMDVKEIVDTFNAVIRLGASAHVPTVAVVPRRAAP